jgi:hypothetical protein
LTANVDNNTYVIPSFISLENKINSLTENFNNLVYAPKTGEATFNFDGGSQTIELKGFSCTPESLLLNKPENFEVENNQIFIEFDILATLSQREVKSLPIIKSLQEGEDKKVNTSAISVYACNKGDTLWDISKRLGVSEDDVLKTNKDLEFPLSGEERIVIYRELKK